MTQLELHFSQGYSYQTSLPAYRDNKEGKQRQMDMLLELIRKGANNLLQLSEKSHLPQSTVSGRCNDLLNMGKIKYEGTVVYKDRKRKMIVLTNKEN